VLQYVAVCCRVLWSVIHYQCQPRCQSSCSCGAVRCGVLQSVAACCSVLPCVAVCCGYASLMSTSVPKFLLMCCSALQNVAVRCSALQCVAVRCSELTRSCVCIRMYFEFNYSIFSSKSACTQVHTIHPYTKKNKNLESRLCNMYTYTHTHIVMTLQWRYIHKYNMLIVTSCKYIYVCIHTHTHIVPPVHYHSNIFIHTMRS